MNPMKHLTGNLLAAVVLATTVRGQVRVQLKLVPHPIQRLVSVTIGPGCRCLNEDTLVLLV
jgi:hypothetical protein